jgi:hypothetical protein
VGRFVTLTASAPSFTHMVRPSRRRIAPAVLSLFARLAFAIPVVAQMSTADLESRLAGLTGLERARALTQLVDAHKIDDPERALRYGVEALHLFEATPDSAAHASVLNEMGWAQMTPGRYDSATTYLDRARRFATRSVTKWDRRARSATSVALRSGSVIHVRPWTISSAR